MEFSGKTFYWLIILTFCLSGGLSTKLRCYRSAFEDYEEAPLDDLAPLVNSTDPCIDFSKCTFIFIFGFNGNPYGFAVSTLIPTLIDLKICNVLLLNWREKASGGLLGPIIGYPVEIVPATAEVGKEFGKTLTKLVHMGLNEDIHLIGHSVGAHLACYAGRETMNEGYVIPWITGLDPARPGFDPPVFTDPIDSKCAKFVDIVHCDPSGFATNVSAGDVDFWPNYGEYVNGSRHQPGCPKSTSILDLAVNGNFCSHNRCIELYNASLVEPMILEGEEASDYEAWLHEDYNDTDTNFIGLMVEKTKTGNFYLVTAGVYPFGEGPAGIEP